MVRKTVVSGGREATRADTPTINTKQSQCVVCWRMFSCDSAAESHTSYRKPVTSECKDPIGLGMESKERADGVLVWSVPMDPVQRERLEKMWAARRKTTV